ncbi:Sodium- and chloride-dependent glycine transporter 2 [Nymphon striatum]|nr:Sodium- and chloride-dependent glycine transporter 2 [Nymphon striatum]
MLRKECSFQSIEQTKHIKTITMPCIPLNMKIVIKVRDRGVEKLANALDKECFEILGTSLRRNTKHLAMPCNIIPMPMSWPESVGLVGVDDDDDYGDGDGDGDDAGDDDDDDDDEDEDDDQCQSKMADNTEKIPEKAVDFQGEDVGTERGVWGGKLEFFLTCLGGAVGLGNVWRFPYLAFKHGGGSFLIPYTITLVVVAIPMLFLEMALGQYSALGSFSLIKNIAPIFTGVGYSIYFRQFISTLTYNAIISWTLFYFCVSMAKTLPWRYCDHDFNTKGWQTVRIHDKADWSKKEIVLNKASQPRSYILETGNGNIVRRNKRYLQPNSEQFTPQPEEEPYNAIDNASETQAPTALPAPSDCFDDRAYANCTSTNSSNVYYSNKCYSISDAEKYHYNNTPVNDRKSASEEYLNLFAIGKSDGMGDFGHYQWRIALCYIACWVLIWLCCSRGIKSIGKVVYFTALFPYVVLFILLIRGVTLHGATEGIKYFITPKWEELSTITVNNVFELYAVWQEAAVQIFFSVGIASGTMMTLASYNKFSHNITRDAVLVSVINSLTSILAGFVVFSVLGFMSLELDKDIGKVAAGGPGLAFIVYPDALTRLPISPLWSVLFFFMLITLGLGSQFGGVENAVICVIDEFPHLRPRKWLILLVFCLLSCVVGLILCFGNGTYIVDLYFSVSGWSFFIISLLEVVIVAHMYGLDKFFKNVEAMTDTKLGSIVKNCLRALYCFIIPAVLIVMYQS